MSIKKSLRNSILAAASIPLFIITIIIFIYSYMKYVDLVRDSASSLAVTYSNGFIAQLNVQTESLEGLAMNIDVQGIAMEYYNGVGSGVDSVYYANVQDILNTNESYTEDKTSYYIYDVNGYYITGSNEAMTGDWSEYMSMPVEEITETMVMQNSNINEQADSIEIITPIITKKKIVGLLRENISAEYFGSFLPDNGSVCIINNNGDYLFNSNVFSNNEKLDEKAREIRLYSTNNGYISETSSSLDVYGYSKINDYDWCYIIKYNTNDFKSLLFTLPVLLLLTLIILLIFVNRTSNALSNRYTSPIMILKDKMSEAASGNLDVSCEIASDDEFGELSTKFNDMMNIICDNYNQLTESKKTLEFNEHELKKNYDHIEQLAYHDGLTGLYNRVALMKYAYNILHNNKDTFSRHAIMFIDLDNFKNVNDTLGHDYGDILLKQVSAKLSRLISDEDILARTGGDEFIILKKSYETKDELREFAHNIVSIVHHPFDLDGETAHISLSLGISLFPDNGLSISELIKNADIAMYNAKNSGKNSYQFFESQMEDDFNRKNDLADILDNVIENDEVYLQYQPQASVTTGRITGFEALMRIDSDTAGFIPPSEFIPIAEDSGAINQLGEWALYEACCFNQKLIDNGYDPLVVSVNVSAVQLRHDNLIDIIRSIPEKTGMSLEYLQVEITESILMNSFEHNLDLINQIKELGPTIALDDFGTGYSSFNYLTRIPIDTLKIDKSFIDGICSNEKDRCIADTIISLAHKMDIKVVAEGVEDLNQLRILQNQLCDTLQGYLFSKPLSSSDFITLLEKNKD